jgi:hypothetical protein
VPIVSSDPFLTLRRRRTVDPGRPREAATGQAQRDAGLLADVPGQALALPLPRGTAPTLKARAERASALATLT